MGLFLTTAAALVGTLGLLEKKFGFGQKIVEETGGGILSTEFEESRRRRFRESERGQAQAAAREAAFADPRMALSAAQQEAAVQETRRVEESRQRNDIFLHGPAGTGISTTPGGAPEQAVELGRQSGNVR